MVSREEVKKMAELARIDITPKDEEDLANDMERILSYVGELDKVKVPKVEVIENLENVLRDDEFPHEKGIYSQSLLQASAQSERNYVAVKKIL